MNFKKILRRVWHDLFYVITLGLGVKFALRCKDVTALIDLGAQPKSGVALVRFKLHLSICQACNDYSRLSGALSTAARQFILSGEKSMNFERLQTELLSKYSRKA